MSTTDKTRRYIARWTAFTALWIFAIAGVSAQTGSYGLYKPPQLLAASNISPLSADCLNETGGSFQAAAVNVGGQTDFYVIIAAPAPEGGVIITVTSDNSGIVAPVDISSGGIPTLFVPEGQNITTSQFRQIGNAVGEAQLDITATPSVHPDTGIPLSFSVPVAGWDVGDTQKRFIDANAPGNHCRVSDDDPALSTDGNKLASCGNSDITSVATDGVTPVLMRLKTGLAGQGCFEIMSNAPPAQGTVSAGVVNTQTVDSLEQAFSFYFPPDEFVDTAATRTVDVEFTYTPIVAGKRANTTRFRDTLTLVRPPVVLMHGLWADKKSWEDDFIDNVKGPGPDDIVVRGDYSASNAEGLAENQTVAGEWIDEAIRKARKQDIALTQVDYIGHSMGGLLGRLHMSGSAYQEPANLDKGDIRRFVSLNTPHFGTNFANLLIALHNNPDTRARIVNDIAELVPGPGQSGTIVNGAVCDLAENSAGLSQLKATIPTAHVYTATRGPNPTTDADGNVVPALFLDFPFITLFEDTLTGTICTSRDAKDRCTSFRNNYPPAVVDSFRFREKNDAIVPLSSQLGGVLGGITGTAASNDPEDIHFALGKLAGISDFSLPEESAAARRIRTILDAESTSPLLTSLAPVGGTGDGVSRTVPGQGASVDADVFLAECSTGGGMDTLTGPLLLAAAAQAFNPGINIVSPVEGQVFTPGDTLSISVEVTDSQLIGGVSVGTGFGGTLDKMDPPYDMSITIPDEVSGVLTLRPRTSDITGAPQTGQPVTIIVRRSTPPDRLSVSDSAWVKLPEPADLQKKRISVKGIYDGVEVNLNPSVTGTTYVSSDTSIVTVDSEGVLTGVNYGRAVVITENMRVKAFTMVDVTDPSGILPPEEVTYKLDIQRSGIRLNRRTGFFTQRVTITNPTELPIPGSMALLMEGLTPGVTAANRTTSSDRILPGSPQFDIPMDSRLHSLLPGATATFDIEFVNPNRERIRYTPRIFVARDF